MSHKVEFDAPKGIVPEGTNPGDEFDLVCSFRLSKSGSVCLTVMGSTEMPGYKDDDKEKPTRQYKDEAAAMVSSAPAQNGGDYGS